MGSHSHWRVGRKSGRQKPAAKRDAYVSVLNFFKDDRALIDDFQVRITRRADDAFVQVSLILIDSDVLPASGAYS